MGLVQRRSQLFALNSSNALLEFLLEGTPAVQEHTRDSKREVDLRLKTVCEAFIRSTQQLLQQPVHSLILRVRAQTGIRPSHWAGGVYWTGGMSSL